MIAVLYPLAVLALSGVALLRQSGVPATSTVWAEDGTIFYQQARLNGFLHTLTIPYNGYFELGPRLLVQLTRFAPMIDASAVMAAAGAALVSLVCCYVFHASRGVLQPVWSRVLLGAVIILLPLATGEILNNVVNIGWWLFFGAFWALISRARTNTDAILAGFVCLLATATEPLVALLLPLAAIRVLVMRSDVRQEAPVLGLLIGLVYQGFGILKASGSASTFGTVTTHGVVQALGIRVGWGWLSGNDLSNHLIGSSHAALWQATGYVVLAAIVILAFLLRDRATSFFVTTAIAFAIITFTLPVIVRGVGPNLVSQPLFVGSRYSATPILLIWSALLVEAVQIGRSRPHLLVRFAPTVACLLLLVPVWVIDFRAANDRTAGPRWSEQVSAAVDKCRVQSRSVGTLKISPPGWLVNLPCRDISP